MQKLLDMTFGATKTNKFQKGNRGYFLWNNDFQIDHKYVTTLRQLGVIIKSQQSRKS